MENHTLWPPVRRTVKDRFLENDDRHPTSRNKSTRDVKRAEARALSYAEGWATGDTGKILGAATGDFVFTDPDGPVSRERFQEYHGSFMEANGSTMDITGVVAYAVGDKLVACCLWETEGVRGTGLITVGDGGVEREEVSIL